jgi:serine protease Do
MRRFHSYGPSIVVALAAALTLLFGPAAVHQLQAARTTALVTLAQDRLDRDDLLERLNQATRDIAQAVEPSVVYVDVLIRNPRTGAIGRSNGSGWVFDSDGHIVTNAHVVDGAETIQVQFYDGRMRRAVEIGIDRSTDVAVIKVEADDSLLFPARRASALPVFQGDRVFAFGSPFGFKFSMSEGIVSGLGRSARTGVAMSYTNYIQTDAAINPGNSGGPLVDVRGRVIGMNTAIITDRSRMSDPGAGVSGGIGFAIPLDTIESVTTQLLGTGIVLKGFLGVNLRDIDTARLEAAGFTEGSGVEISDVLEGTPAAISGIRRGDVVTRINGQRTPRMPVMQSLIGNRLPGEVITLTVWRNGELRDIDVQLMAARVAPSGELVPLDREMTQALASQERRLEAIASALARFGLTSLSDAEDGVTIEMVRPNSNAAEVGFRAGQRIVGVGAERIDTRTDFFAALARATARNDGSGTPVQVRTPDGGEVRLQLNVAD